MDKIEKCRTSKNTSDNIADYKRLLEHFHYYRDNHRKKHNPGQLKKNTHTSILAEGIKGIKSIKSIKGF